MHTRILSPPVGVRLGLVVVMLGALILAPGLIVTAAVPGLNVTYTLDADFDQGTLLNVNHNAPNNDQLQLNTATEPFPFVNVAASGRGTAVRIDVNTGIPLGEFSTAPIDMRKDPSRTTVDQLGNVWVANRLESGSIGGVPHGSVVRIGLLIGGTRVDASGTPDANGQFLAPPFQYNTCVDRHGATIADPPDGLIKTSRGLGNILPWLGGVDTFGGVSAADDECIINYTRVRATGTRTVAIDANNDVWVGGLNSPQWHEKLSGVTGQSVPGSLFSLSCGGYGGLIDGNGVLWSARGTGRLLRFDTNTMTGTCLTNVPDGYGLGIDPNTGHIWHTALGNNRVYELDPNGVLLNTYGHGFYYAQGVAVDDSGNVWVAHSILGGGNTVGRLTTGGVWLGNIPVGSGPTGVAVDSNGKVWVANYYSHNAVRIDPALGAFGAVDATVGLGAGAYPYNYSDMTGFVSIGATSPQGTWNVAQDGGPGCEAVCTWNSVTWNTEPEGDEPAGTSITVQARVADTEAGLASATFGPVTNGAFLALTGRFIEVQVTLQTSVQDTSPVLSDITIQGGDPTAITLASFTAEVDAGGVALAWETGTEIDNAGFNLYRAPSANGPWNKINGVLIAAQGDAVAGASYSFVDAPGYGTFFYKLEDVDFNGVSELHGPVAATLAAPFRRPQYRPTLPW